MRAKRKVKNRIRKSTKNIYIIIAVALIVISLYDMISKSSKSENVGTKTEQVYSYTNRFKYDYGVNLVDNKYTKGMDLSNKNIAYITDLVNNIDLNLNYEYEGEKASKLNSEYEIIGRMQAVYTKDGEEQKVLEKDDVLLEKKTRIDSTNKIKIFENIKLDLKDKNNLLNELKQKMGLSFKATYSVILKIIVNTEVEGEVVKNTYSPVVTIDLAEKTTQIKGENNKEDTEYIAKQMPRQSSSYTIIFDIIALAIAVYLLRYVSKAKVTNRIKNEYKQELNRLLKLCQDRIVRVNTKPETTNSESTVIVKDFGEIVKLSEELFKPILCYIDEQNDEAWFSVMSNNVDYRYILRK